MYAHVYREVLCMHKENFLLELTLKVMVIVGPNERKRILLEEKICALTAIIVQLMHNNGVINSWKFYNNTL